MTAFVSVIQSMISRIGPYFLHNKNIGTFIESVAHVYDEGIESLEQGLDLGNPIKCDPSAFPVLSVDRGIRLYPTEIDDSKRLRLSQWYQLRRGRGTHVGELKHSQPYFLPDTPVIRIVHQDGAGASATWWTIGADGTVSIHQQTPSNWNYDGLTTHWSRFWVIIYIPARFIDVREWDDGGHYDDPDELYDGMTTAIAQDIVNMFLEWHSAHSRLGAIILATDPTSFDPTLTPAVSMDGWTTLPIGNWGSPFSPPPDTSVPTRPPSAFWLYEGVP